MRIEWVEEQVQQLSDLEASVVATPPPASKRQEQQPQTNVSLQMDYDLADAISEPRIDQEALQAKLRERLEKARRHKARKNEPKTMVSSNAAARRTVKIVP